MSADKPWHEDDTFWKETLPILFPDSRVQEAEREVEQVLALIKIPAAGRPGPVPPSVLGFRAHIPAS